MSLRRDSCGDNKECYANEGACCCSEATTGKKGAVSNQISLQGIAMPGKIRVAIYELKRSVDQDTVRHTTYAIANGGIVINWAIRDW